MKKFLNCIKENWLLYFIMLQPVIDIIAYFQTKIIGSSFSWIIRILFLLIVSAAVFYNSNNKKKLILQVLPFITYFSLHIINLYRINSLDLILDLKYFVLIFQMPILTILLIDYLKSNSLKIDLIRKGMVGSFIIITIVLILSFLTNTYEITYEYSNTGIIGWFTGSNTPSMILCALSPWIMYYFSSRKNNYLYFVMSLLVFASLYFNATKACYITLVTSLVVITFSTVIAKNNINDKKFKIVISSFFLILSIGLYPYSFTAVNRNMAIKNIEYNEEAKNEIVNDDSSHDDVNTSSTNKPTSDNNSNNNNNSNSNNVSSENNGEYTDEEILKMLKISHIYAELIEIKGEKKVINAMRNHLSAEDLSNNRLLKVINAQIESEDSDIITKFFGLGYSRFQKVSYDLETDLDAIYYYYGYIGFTLYISFIIYFYIKLVVTFFKKASIICDGEYLILCYLVPLLVTGGQYSGAYLRKPNANIYLSLFLVLIYFKYANTKLLKKKEVNKKKKISFLCLHLGYGGIETATINSANALSDKYEVEIVSFYNLEDNQEKYLNKNIKVKYLCKYLPNKEKIKDSFYNHKLFNILHEGIIALKVLLEKRLLIIKEIENSDADAIVSTRYTFSILLSKYGKDNIIKIAQEHHHHNNNQKYINVIKNKYYNIDYLCALTKRLQEDYNSFLKNNSHTKVVLLPNILPDKNEELSNCTTNNLISVGRLDDGKKINELIEMFSELDNKKNKLYIIGDGIEKNNLEQLAKSLKISDRVVFKGYLNYEEQEKYYLDSSAFMMTSISEGLPMVLLEAMSHGIPCIAYETDSGICDIISDNINGYVIKNRDKKQYIEKLNKLLNNKELLKKFSKEALNTTNKFKKENVLTIWDRMLNE